MIHIDPVCSLVDRLVLSSHAERLYEEFRRALAEPFGAAPVSDPRLNARLAVLAHIGQWQGRETPRAWCSDDLFEAELRRVHDCARAELQS